MDKNEEEVTKNLNSAIALLTSKFVHFSFAISSKSKCV